MGRMKREKSSCVMMIKNFKIKTIVKHFLLILTSLCFTLTSWGRITLTTPQSAQLKNYLQQWWHLPSEISTELMQGQIISWASAQTLEEKKQQTLKVKVVGLHPRTCRRGLKKISRYEDYKTHMSFLKESKYDEIKQEVYFVIDHLLLPFPMILTFKLPRIHGPSDTPFSFDRGIFIGLNGVIHVQEIGARCLYSMDIDWTGPSTGLAAPIIEAFAQTLTKIGLEHLIRISHF
jgi:hypothetical protein